MVNAVDFNGRPFHFIGVGGIGMSALAYILAQKGFCVSGSDVRPNHITHKLESIGVNFFGKQEPSNIEYFNGKLSAELTIVSTNIPVQKYCCCGNSW